MENLHSSCTAKLTRQRKRRPFIFMAVVVSFDSRVPRTTQVDVIAASDDCVEVCYCSLKVNKALALPMISIICVMREHMNCCVGNLACKESPTMEDCSRSSWHVNSYWDSLDTITCESNFRFS